MTSIEMMYVETELQKLPEQEKEREREINSELDDKYTQPDK